MWPCTDPASVGGNDTEISLPEKAENLDDAFYWESMMQLLRKEFSELSASLRSDVRSELQAWRSEAAGPPTPLLPISRPRAPSGGGGLRIPLPRSLSPAMPTVHSESVGQYDFGCSAESPSHGHASLSGDLTTPSSVDDHYVTVAIPDAGLEAGNSGKDLSTTSSAREISKGHKSSWFRRHPTSYFSQDVASPTARGEASPAESKMAAVAEEARMWPEEEPPVEARRLSERSRVSGGRRRFGSGQAPAPKKGGPEVPHHVPARTSFFMAVEPALTPDDVFSSTDSRGTLMYASQRTLRHCIENKYFDITVGVMILLNSLLMGLQAEFAAQGSRQGGLEEPSWLRASALFFCAAFSAELMIRLHAHGMEFFTMPGWTWNVFDLLLVVLQVFEEVSTIIHQEQSGPTGLSFLRILRVLRFVRIIRLVRILRLIRELRTLVQSIGSTVTSLMWTISLLLLLIFVTSIIFTQVVADLGQDSPETVAEGTDAYEYYGSLFRSGISLYQAITGGLSWRDLTDPLFMQNSPFMVVLLCLYIAFSMFALLNVITGVFVESAMASAKQENKLDLVNRLRQVVNKIELDKDGRMTWEAFQKQLNLPQVEAYFRELELGKCEASSLFDLLDFEKTKSINPNDFIAGCLRIHGNARAMELVTVMSEVHQLYMQWEMHASYVEHALNIIFEQKTPSSQRVSGGTTHFPFRSPSNMPTPAARSVASPNASSTRFFPTFEMAEPFKGGGATLH